MSAAIAEIGFHPVRITPRTIWLFVSIEDDDGCVGWGEATLDEYEAAVARVARALMPGLAGIVAAERAVAPRLPMRTLPEAAFACAVLQACADLEARRAGVSLALHLGAPAVIPIPVYANFNRRTRDRTPGGMAASARQALKAGHTALKIAPFDEVTPNLDRSAMRDAMGLGLARLAAIRDAVGRDVALMADCHWRFDVPGARELIAAAAPLDLHWIECPIAEMPETIPDLVDLRRRTARSGTRLAGLETQIGLDGFRPYLDAGAYDVMMPDVKYAGGPHDMLRIADALRQAGVEFSPHNPTGPVCHGHSLHLCAAVPGCGRLEMQFDESPLFDDLCDTAPPAVVDSCVDPAVLGPGLGLALRAERLEKERADVRA